MKPIQTLTSIVLLVQGITAFAVPDTSISTRDDTAIHERSSWLSAAEELWKRKGGGAGGGKGGGGGGSSSGGSSSGGSSSGGSSSTGGSSSGGTSGGGRGSSGSGVGGATTVGSGPRPQFGGGGFYGGGARQPYRSGSRSPSGIAPFALGAGLGALAFWPGLWYHPIYYYPYTHPYTYHNASSGQNETKPVGCGCDQTVECSCDDTNNSTLLREIVGNGSVADMNSSLVSVADVNGTSTILINGTLPNGTTASGGSDDPNAGAGLQAMLEQAGWWPVLVTAGLMVFV